MYPRIKVNFKRLRKNLFAISEIIKEKRRMFPDDVVF